MPNTPMLNPSSCGLTRTIASTSAIKARATRFPIVLIHGANGSLHNYEEWARTLSKRYRVISLDLPGHGLTGATATDRYDMDTDVGTIRAVADHLALDRFVLAGHSMGGGIAMAFAQNSPDELLGLVLISSVIPWRPRSDDPEAYR